MRGEKPPQLLPEGDRDRRVRIATAAVLLEVAHADELFTADEELQVQNSLQRFFGLDTGESEELVEISNRIREQSIDLWRFTTIINQEVTEEEKQHIIEMLWEIVYTDGRLDRYEDHLLHKLCRVLRISHADMIRAKMRARENINREG